MTNRTWFPIALVALLACAGCAVRIGAKPAETTPSAAPRGEAPKAPKPQAAPDGPVVATGGAEAPEVSAPGARQGNPAGTPAVARESADGQAPPATASVHVFSAQQAVSARPSSLPTTGGAPPPSPPSAEAESTVKTTASNDAIPNPGELQLVVVASASRIATGGLMTVDVMASSSTAVVDAPLHLTFDPEVMEFVDGATGDFLTQGGSNVVFLADGRRPGDVAIAAGRVERETGARGAGLLCRVRFRGIGSGTTPLLVDQAKAWGTRGEELTVSGAGTSVAVN